MHGECNLALQMASTEKLDTRTVIKFSQQQVDTPSKTLKSASTLGKHAVSRTVFSIDTHALEKELQASTTRKEEGERRK